MTSYTSLSLYRLTLSTYPFTHPFSIYLNNFVRWQDIHLLIPFTIAHWVLATCQVLFWVVRIQQWMKQKKSCLPGAYILMGAIDKKNEKKKKEKNVFVVVVIVQWLSCVWLFATPWTAARQASLSFTISQSLLKHKSTELVMPCNHLVSVIPFSSCLQSFPALRSFTVN